jgi:prepilin-type N-terminal cleavage/methylation domain-containing protein
MQRNQQGFTLVEITAVLVLMAIISAYVIGRSVNTEQNDETLKVWGLSYNKISNQYWLFEGQDPNDISKQKKYPGEQNTKISLADRGIDSMNPTSFTLFFDRFGRPYTAYTDEITNAPLGPGLFPINISAAGQTRTIRVSPETGVAQ